MIYKRPYLIKKKNIGHVEKGYIEKNYMKGEKAIIPIQLEKPEDLYMKYDYKKIRLSESVCNYIEKIVNMIDSDIDIILEIHCPTIEEKMQKEMIKTIKNNYRLEIEEIHRNQQEEDHKSRILLVAGIVLLIINLLIDQFLRSSIISNFVCVVWWVAIWDMIELQTLDKSESNAKEQLYQQLYNAEIMFGFENN